MSKLIKGLNCMDLLRPAALGILLLTACGGEKEIAPQVQRITNLEAQVQQLETDLNQVNEEKENLTMQLIAAINDRGSGNVMSLGIGLGLVIFILATLNLFQFQKGQETNKQLGRLIDVQNRQIESKKYDVSELSIGNADRIEKHAIRRNDGGENGFDQC